MFHDCGEFGAEFTASKRERTWIILREDVDNTNRLIAWLCTLEINLAAIERGRRKRKGKVGFHVFFYR